MVPRGNTVSRVLLFGGRGVCQGSWGEGTEVPTWFAVRMQRMGVSNMWRGVVVVGGGGGSSDAHGSKRRMIPGEDAVGGHARRRGPFK